MLKRISQAPTIASRNSGRAAIDSLTKAPVRTRPSSTTGGTIGSRISSAIRWSATNDPIGVERAHEPRRHLAEPDLARQRLHHPAHRELPDDEDEQEIGGEIRGRVAADRAVRGQPHPDEHHDQRQRARDHPDQHLRPIFDEGGERDREQHARQAQAAGEQGRHFAASARGAWRARNTWPMISSIGTSSMPMSAIGRSLSRRAAVSVTRSRATRSSARSSEHSRSSP